MREYNRAISYRAHGEPGFRVRNELNHKGIKALLKWTLIKMELYSQKSCECRTFSGTGNCVTKL